MDIIVEENGSEKKRLTFHLGSEKYGIPVLRTREIIKAQDFIIRSVPGFPSCHIGVITLRDKVFSIIDLKMAFGMGTTDITEKTSIVIVEIQRPDQAPIQIGLLVDHVDEVMDFLDSEIESNSSVVQSDDEHVIGFGKKSDNELVIFLDLDKAIANI
ncbi:MAG: response regulator receiver modulated CheW protein [uncultured bacterium (gcode 4)]|uniref:Response regulator receiver modulated CheW protein n=1 Tax=uncultured bacterium (gcode 4) TaxID=1234023 RepID=K1XX92_9BACT|nr:MAG: response regulator receiver modulated CheW protein [uncultured bacterium (gcode 4)]